MECKKINREKYLKKEFGTRRYQKNKKKNENKVFWITTYDPRCIHPRQIITRNYHLLAADPQFAKLLPRKNIIAGCRRLKNLLEIVSPTVPRRPTTLPPPNPPPSPPPQSPSQHSSPSPPPSPTPSSPTTPTPPGPHSPLSPPPRPFSQPTTLPTTTVPPPPGIPPDNDNNNKWGSFHCKNYKQGKRCDMCSHMKEVDFIESYWFNKRNRIHGHLAHDYVPANTIRWYIYCIEDIPCKKQITGSTINPRQRWSQYKSSCNSGKSKSTGLSKHFSQWEGCPNDPGRQKETLRFTLIDYYDTTESKLVTANHSPGAQCRCSECSNLKDLEDKWIMKISPFYGLSSLNTRDEIKSKTRYNFKT